MVIRKLQDLDKLDKKIEYKISNGLLVYTVNAWLLCMDKRHNNIGWENAGMWSMRLDLAKHKYGWWLNEQSGELAMPLEITPQELIW